MSTSRSRSPSPSSALRGPHFTSALLALARAASTAGYSLQTIHLHPQQPIAPRSPRTSPSVMPPPMPAIRIAPQPVVPSPTRRRSKRASYSTPTQSPKRSRLSQPTRRSDPVPPHAVAAVAAAAATATATATATSSAFWGTVMDDSTAHRTTTLPIFPPAPPVAPAHTLHPITPTPPTYVAPTHAQPPTQVATQPQSLRARTGAFLARISPFRSTTSSPRVSRVDQHTTRASPMPGEHGGAASSHSRSPSLSGVSHLVSSKRPRPRHLSDFGATALHRTPSAPMVPMAGGTTAAASSGVDTFGMSASSAAEAKFSCELCSAKFRRKSDKNRHVRVVHEKSRPFQCPVCEKTFGEKSNMLKHRTSVHDDVRTFRCPYCDESFAQRGLCDTHVRNVHGKKQAKYFCEHCGLPFSKKQQLTEHYEQQHPQWLASYAPGYQPTMMEQARGQAGPSSVAVAAAAAAQARAQAQMPAQPSGSAYERAATMGGVLAYEQYGAERVGASAQRAGGRDEGAWMRGDETARWTRTRRDVASERMGREEDATSAARGAQSRDAETESRRGGVTRHVDGC
eukprot:TRINITY_DN24345_c0_g1_i1.p1 TRINITY_DN24345_c0_g1~~TRINITY_DN24345_c0_g1_i1.p1  ORF type:complete len:611 (-),score=90.28 TRINITY_DN24345_c0_g1_i1:213-1916(-)